MNVFSYLPPSSLSFRAPPLLDEASSSTSDALSWKHSAFKTVQLPLDVTEILLKKYQTTTTPTDTHSNEWDSISSVGSPTNFNFSPVMVSGSTELRHNGGVKPFIYRKYQFLDRHHRQSQVSNFHYVHPTSMDQSQTKGGSELASLKALCDADVSTLSSRTRHDSFLKEEKNDGRENGDNCCRLKFGIERILSDNFGKCKQENGKENNTRGSISNSYPAHPACHCNSLCVAHGKHSHDLVAYSPNQLPSLSVVQALHTPRYSFSSSVDSLPGPYSVLSTDPYNSSQSKRKRSWSRAVFSNLQRKGLEKRFEVQKYVTKMDRRQLANMLGLTDAQVKVWFQNRRMKWRHAQQQGGKDKEETEEQDEEVDIDETTDTNVDQSILTKSETSHEIDDNDTEDAVQVCDEPSIQIN